MIVELTYFKDSGKYYSESKYITEKVSLWEIWAEVLELRTMRRLPGLIINHSDFIVLISVPNHIHNHPHLIVGESIKELLKDV